MHVELAEQTEPPPTKVEGFSGLERLRRTVGSFPTEVGGFKPDFWKMNPPPQLLSPLRVDRAPAGRRLPLPQIIKCQSIHVVANLVLKRFLKQCKSCSNQKYEGCSKQTYSNIFKIIAEQTSSIRPNRLGHGKDNRKQTNRCSPAFRR